jgi:serine/threonine-protein kinase RsbW
VRLAVSAVAQRIGFDIEDIEDLKVASAEACTSLLAGNPQQIDISLTVEDGLMLCFEASGFAKEAGDAGESDGMSQYLLDALVDSCEIEDVGGVIQGLRLKKTL